MMESPQCVSRISIVSCYVWQNQAKRNAGCRTNGQRNAIALEGPGPFWPALAHCHSCWPST